MTNFDLAAALLSWYVCHARDLPWRRNPHPYAIWVSEVMLQQTRVETVIPYFERWMERFPTIEALAQAPQREILVAWEGLGYYSRARHLHRAARIVMQDYAGQMPSHPKELCKLPGVGRYTAGAIASIAFGLDEPVLDGNIRRVLARFFNVTHPVRSPDGERLLWQLAKQHLPPGKAGEYNQALMDLGATICSPRAPDCIHCPLAEGCQAQQLGVQEQRPVTRSRPSTPHYTVAAAVIQRGRQFLIAQRPQEGLLGGLWEFPGGKLQPGESLADCLQREICEELDVQIVIGDPLGVYRHAYTHFRVTLHAFFCSMPNGDRPKPVQVHQVQWVSAREMSEYPMGKIDRQIARDLLAREVDSC